MLMESTGEMYLSIDISKSEKQNHQNLSQKLIHQRGEILTMTFLKLSETKAKFSKRLNKHKKTTKIKISLKNCNKLFNLFVLLHQIQMQFPIER